MAEGHSSDRRNSDTADGSFAVYAPDISLPKGGATRGIGEKFAGNPVAGTALCRCRSQPAPGVRAFAPSFRCTTTPGQAMVRENACHVW